MSDLVEQLIALVGPSHVLQGADVAARPAGWRLGPSAARAIVRPADTGEVAAVLRLCHAAGQPAMKFSGAMVERMQEQMDMGSDPASQFGQGCANAERVGAETVTVPGGTFEAVRYRLDTGSNPGDAWVVPDLPFGMIRWTGDLGETVVLTGRGDDATSAITGTPLEMPGG